MRYEIIEGDLVVKMCKKEQERLQVILDENPQDFDSDDVMFDLFEWMVCNSDLCWISAYEIAALTDAPILGTKDDAGDVVDAYAFMDYQVTSPQRQLLDKGECTFISGDNDDKESEKK